MIDRRGKLLPLAFRFHGITGSDGVLQLVQYKIKLTAAAFPGVLLPQLHQAEISDNSCRKSLKTRWPLWGNAVPYCRLQHSKELRSFPVSEIFDTEADNHRAMASGIRSLQEQLAEVDALSLLESAKQQYNGVARLGIEAMQLKFIGLSNTDIAAYYGIKANYLGAAVHRAAERLRNNAEFLNSLEYEPLKKSSKAS